MWENDDTIIAHNEKRSVTQTTHLKCAHCGGDNTICNDRVLPWRLEPLSQSLFRLYWVCKQCKEEYDLGLVKI